MILEVNRNRPPVSINSSAIWFWDGSEDGGTSAVTFGA